MKSPAAARVFAVVLTFLVGLSGGPRAAAQVEGDPVDLVIVLDVSGTMRGLIDSTRFNLWEIVSDLAEAEPTPRLRVALVTYGNQRGSRHTGWVRVETNLTEDLDRVSERLFHLKSRGAEEMVGRALQTALERLDWSDSEHALKLLFIAGNEPADQDPDVRVGWMSEAAADAGIFLSAIFCGSEREAAAVSWREMAELAEGQFATIDSRAGTRLVETPHDRELAELGELFNETVVPIGKPGEERRKRHAKEDKHARSLSLAVAASRAQAKSTPLFASSTDLVSLYESGELGRFPLDDKDLPRFLRKMNEDERAAYLQEVLEVRQDIRKRIAQLSVARRASVAERLAEAGAAPLRTFDSVVRRTVRERAESFGYSFPARQEG